MARGNGILRRQWVHSSLYADISLLHPAVLPEHHRDDTHRLCCTSSAISHLTGPYYRHIRLCYQVHQSSLDLLLCRVRGMVRRARCATLLRYHDFEGSHGRCITTARTGDWRYYPKQ